MKFSQFFIDRPIFAAVLSLLIVVGGALALLAAAGQRISRASSRRRSSSAASIPAPTRRSSPRRSRRRSSSSSTASRACSTCSRRRPPTAGCTLTVTFALGTDLDNAQVQVQNRVSQALPRLPQDVQRIGVTTEKASPDFLLVAHLVSPDERYDMLYLSNFAHLQVKDELARIAGVGSVQIFGAGEYSMRVWLDPDKLAARQLTATDVVRAIREQNVQVAAGALGAPPRPVRHDLPALGQRAGPAATGGGVRGHRRPRDAGGPDHAARRRRPRRARLEHVRAAQPARQPAGGRDRHRPASGLERARGVGAGARGDGAAQAVVSRRASSIASSTTRRSTCASRSVSVVETLFEAILLVVIVVIVFLQTWRASIIPLVAVPVSLIGTFAVMLGLGFSLNTLSLFGLVLAIGIVVDDAIVVVENVERHIELGLSPIEATRKAMERSVGPDHRHCARAVRGVRADGLHQRADRAVLPAVRADDRDLDRDLGVQLADAEPGAGVAAAARARRAARLAAARHRSRLRLVLPAASTASSRARRRPMPAAWRGILRVSVAAMVLYAGLVGLTMFGFSRVPQGSCRRRTRTTWWRSRSCPTRRRSIAPTP